MVVTKHRTFGTNMKKNEITPNSSVAVKNNVFFTRNLSTIIPATSENTIDIIDIKVIVTPYVVIEYPNCFAIVGKNPYIGPIPEFTKKGHKWRCAHKSCNSKLYIDEGKSTILSEEIKHEHPTPNNLERQIISNQVKRKAMDDLTENPRRKNIPTLPTNLRETQEALINIPTLTNKDEEFLLINDSENKITAFSTMTNLKFLCCQEKIFMDGTFSYCPKYFYQLFTIHTVENGNYIPLVFLLLPNKETKIYEQAFNSLIEVCTSKLSIHFQPKICIVDFEQSIHKAVLTVWPNIILRGCRFHLSQSWWRKIQNLGLSIEYKNHSSEIGKWLKWIFDLLELLEPKNVGTCFAVDFMGIKPMDERIDKFCDYLVDTYIDENAIFPPYLWSSCNISGERTTNALE
ncbi:hypothetical protein AGLY_011755, partial [Aphis glycines]